MKTEKPRVDKFAAPVRSETAPLRSFQFSLRALFIAVAVIAVAIAVRYELHWYIWAGVIFYCIYLSLRNVAYDVRNRPL